MSEILRFQKNLKKTINSQGFRFYNTIPNHPKYPYVILGSLKITPKTMIPPISELEYCLKVITQGHSKKLAFEIVEAIKPSIDHTLIKSVSSLEDGLINTILLTYKGRIAT